MTADEERSTAAAGLRALGFCGADDSVHPHLLVLLAHHYPLVEFGVLFRPDKEGQPRYASTGWVQKLGKLVVACQSPRIMKLAAHLCGVRVNDVLKGDDAFLATLPSLGFRRVQINATAVNGVDTTHLAESVPTLLELVRKYPKLEFILQKNDETRPLWEGVILTSDGVLPTNLSMLVDDSKGTGVAATSWPSPDGTYPLGYAGGIGPDNIVQVLRETQQAAGRGRPYWIDMESSLRSVKNGRDVFDLDKCYEVIDAVCREGMMDHPSFLVAPNSDMR